MRKIQTDDAPAAIGPYSQAVVVGGFVFCSGQIPLKTDGTFVDGPVRDQARQVMENLKAVLHEAGSSFDAVAKVTIYLTDLQDFSVVNEVYAEYLNDEIQPARVTVQVEALPKGAKVEIDCIAML